MLITVPSVRLWFIFTKHASDLWIPSNFVVLSFGDGPMLQLRTPDGG